MTETVSGSGRGPGKASGRRAKGLRFERIHTTAGVHPYDQVTWERRDVVMTNWRDGSVNFEQRGAEFPDSWSVNAVNIVTSKYFRGAVGTPQREWSLKQVIDRVVRSYVAAGEEHGYFAADGEAEIFEHELTYALLHQIFSFNSPVWFNVGTSAPQQVSACQPYDALVSTPGGLVPIGELVADDAVGAKVYDANGLTRIVATKANGEKDVLRLHTKAGYALDVTADHLVWKATGQGTGTFVCAGELRPGDQLEWHRRGSYGEKEIETREIAEAALAGWLQSGGFVAQYTGTNTSLTIEAITVNQAELDWVLGAVDMVFPEVHRHVSHVHTRDERLDCRRVRLYGRVLDGFVEKWGLRARGTDMVVPPHLFTAPLPVVAAYLRSIFQSEGYVGARGRSTLVALDMIAEELVRGLQLLLLRFGIFARVGFKKDARPTRKGCWSLRIQNAGDRRVFADEIGFIDLNKATKLENGFAIPGRGAKATKRLEIAGVEQLGRMPVYDIQTESGEYLAGNVRVHNCFILSVDDTMASILNWYGEEGMIFKGGSGSGINLSRLRSSKELLSSGGNASGPVSFMRGADASAGTIKSGGATRRAAKMVVLDVDHPDVEEFIETKAREEEKVRVLRDAGFDMDLGGADITSVQYQNANNSVRVSDEFMRAVERGDAFGLHSRTTGEALESVDARKLFRSMAQAAWACADPGVQYDDTINDWHTCPETGRITASNPCCFTADTLVVTEAGPVAFEQLVKSLDAGERVRVPSRDMTSGELASGIVSRAWIAGYTASLVDVVADTGLRLRCTPEHRFLTPAGWVQARHLMPGLSLVPVDGDVRVAAVETVDLAEPVPVYDLEVAGTHNFVVTDGGQTGVVVHNSEYMHLDNSSCNLASLNLLKFLSDDDTFDAERFAKTVELVITAMDISICFADFPTTPIRDTTKAYRQLGIGYANLGALLMATGHGYDSEGGRAMAAAITSLMTGTAYQRSAEIAGVVGPYEGYPRNAEGHTRVMRKHAAANDAIRSVNATDKIVLRAATKAWKACLTTGEKNGWRNAQASVLAPTGCLAGDTLVTTSRGLVRLSELGDVYGDRWQDLDVEVSTDKGARRATRFFVNGEEPTRRVVTEGGYRIHGTLTHRVKVVEPGTGSWVWKRLAAIEPGDLLPLQAGTFVGEPARVPLPALEQAGRSGDDRLGVPGEVTPGLAELVGYFVGGGSLRTGHVRFGVPGADLDVVERLRVLSKELFDLEPTATSRGGRHEVVLPSRRLARWWQAAGFAKDLPGVDHAGKAWTPRVPSVLLEANDPDVYSAFLRGLFEAEGSVTGGAPALSIASERFAGEIRTLLLALGLATTTSETSGPHGPRFQIALRNLGDAIVFDELVGFVGERKARLLPQYGPDHGDRDYVFERVARNEDGGVQPTYDLSVPEGLTYVAAGFVSHNTIGLMMDCDTTGIEPDLALVKFKKLVGGGSMQIVNQTVPRALTKLGYQQEQIEAIVEYIAEHGHVIDAPGLRMEHYEVFDCAMGERAIAPMGHVQMIAAVQPFLSGSVSKTINLPEQATVEDIEGVFLEGWKLGCKALAVYRDNCKVGQPLSAGKGEQQARGRAEEEPEQRPVRRRLPKSRTGTTTSFSVGGAEGYMTANTYPDDGLGEVFLKMSKQGSTLAGLMDAFSVAVSVALQYGVPLETYVSKFVNMRFDPAGMTDDPDVRIAHSIVDYIFRRLALDHLPYDTRAALGIYSADERRGQLEGGGGSSGEEEVDVAQLAQSAPREEPGEAPTARAARAVPGQVRSSTELVESQHGRSADAPLCFTCGTKMRPAGSCYVCEGCGSTSGCS